MQISVVILNEEEVSQAVAAWLNATLAAQQPQMWLRTQIEGPVTVTSCRQVKSKHGRLFAVAMQPGAEEADAGCDSIPEEG